MSGLGLLTASHRAACAGLIPPTSGRAKVHGFDMTTEMSEIRKIIGICPQHDVLWDDLTVKEHLEFFAGLKCVPKKEVRRGVRCSWASRLADSVCPE